MDLILTFIDTLQLWHYFLAALILIITSTIIGDSDILPWVAVALFITGLLEKFGVGPLPILILFPIQVLILILFAKPTLYGFRSKNEQPNGIAEDIHSMKNKKIRITKIDTNKNYIGEAVSANGKKWNVTHVDMTEIELGKSYTCINVEGLSLVISEHETEKI
jgi:membrane protein implicated in regulation of membrane protease activity